MTFSSFNNETMKQKETPHFLVPLIVLSVATIGLFVAYAVTSSSDYQNSYYNSVTNGSSISGSVNTKSSLPQTSAVPINTKVQVNDLKVDDKDGFPLLKWSNSSEADVTYEVEYSVKDRTNEQLEGVKVFTGAVGTFIKPDGNKTSGGKTYFSADVPGEIIANADLMKSAIIRPAAGNSEVNYKIDSLMPNKVYSFHVKSYVAGTLSSYSRKAVIFDSNEFVSAADLPFKDISESDWFHGYVSYLYFKSILDKAEYFFPTRELNRAEAVKLVVKSVGAIPTAEDSKFAAQKFADVSESDWFAGYVGYMARRGWIQGTPVKGKADLFAFKAADDLTRSQMLKIIAVAYGGDTANVDAQLIFNDVPVDSWFGSYVEFAYNKGIIADSPGMLFYPARSINRAEISKILSLAMQKLANN